MMGDCKSEEHFKTVSLIVDVAIVLSEKKSVPLYIEPKGDRPF